MLRGRCCDASLKAQRERARAAREALAFSARPTKRRSAHARPAAAPAPGAAPAAARPFLARFTQEMALIVQRGRAEGGAAAAPARSAQHGEAALAWSPAARGRDADGAAADGLLRSAAAEGAPDGSRARGAVGSAAPAAAAGDGLRAGGARRG
jgi:hypothetical protein